MSTILGSGIYSGRSTRTAETSNPRHISLDFSTQDDLTARTERLIAGVSTFPASVTGSGRAPAKVTSGARTQRIKIQSLSGYDLDRISLADEPAAPVDSLEAWLAEPLPDGLPSTRTIERLVVPPQPDLMEWLDNARAYAGRKFGTYNYLSLGEWLIAVTRAYTEPVEIPWQLDLADWLDERREAANMELLSA
jgi:hypothetical protein